MTADERASASCGGHVSAAARGYRPIADYAAIGDCHGGALVARDGSIDWCCLERFDTDPVFCRLLDAEKGGFLWIRPEEPYSATRTYLDGTNILRTEFRTRSGTLAILDFMPVGRKPEAGIHDYVHLNAPGWLVRRIDGIEGTIGIVITYRPSVAFAREKVLLHADGGVVRAPNAPALHCDVPLGVDGDEAVGRAVIRAGDRHFAVLVPETASVTHERLETLLAVTTAFWREWIAYCRYDGPHADMVRRSALVLKLLTYAPSGAIVAAMTTSLPECIGGERNWDYRYCWIRDASLTLHGLAALGYSGEARRFYDFLRRAPRGSLPELQVMYGLDGEKELVERPIDGLSGYCDSRPVRVGNAAYSQRQTDLYGHVMDGVLAYRTLGARPSRADRRMFEELVAFMAQCWPEPDKGIWEVRDAPRHFVHSKAMCWVTVDRAIRLFGGRPDWVSLRERIWQDIALQGRSSDGATFQRAYGANNTDAALLLLPMLDLPVEAASFKPTLAAIEQELRSGDFLRRYRAADGVRGEEGYFVLCSFWLVDALLAAERFDEAKALFERLLGYANDVGLYAEQIDPQTRAFLGNFPQAFTHLGLLGSAVNLALFEKHGAAAIRSTYADRAKRAVGATFGWRGVVAALWQSGGLKARSSRQSRLPHVS